MPTTWRGSSHRSGQERVGKRAREAGNWGCRTLSTRRIRVPSAPELYPFIEAWIQALPASTALHATALHALAHLVTALLVGQSLRPTDLDARVLEPLARPRPPALQARGARLDAALALARLAGATAGAGRAGPGARGARRRHASGAGQRAVWGLGGLHPGRGVAWEGAASRLGGPALPVAQGTLHADGVRADPPGGRGLACLAAGASGG